MRDDANVANCVIVTLWPFCGYARRVEFKQDSPTAEFFSSFYYLI